MILRRVWPPQTLPEIIITENHFGLSQPISHLRLFELLFWNTKPTHLDLTIIKNRIIEHKPDDFLEEFQRNLAANSANLFHLNMRKFKVMNTNFDLIARNAPNLTTIDLSYTLIEDSSVAALLKHCPSLKSLNLSSCKRVTGKCFSTSEQLPWLEFLKLDRCAQLHLRHVTWYLSKRGAGLTTFSLGGERTIDNWNILIQNNMISNLKNVECLEFTFNLKPISVNLSSLCHLKSLNLSNATLNDQDKTISLILNKCIELQTLNLAYGTSLTDEAFTSLPILAPLVELNLDSCCRFRTPLTDKTLEALGFYLNKSLVNLNINTCSRVTASGVWRLLQEAEGSLRRLEINGMIVDCDNLIRMLVRTDRLLCNVYFNVRLEKFDVARVFLEVIARGDIVNSDVMKRLFFISTNTQSFDILREFWVNLYGSRNFGR
jgi:hypothetical protein